MAKNENKNNNDDLFERVVNKVKSLGLIGRIAGVPAGLVLMAYGLKVWNLSEDVSISQLFNTNVDSFSVRIGCLFFIICSAALVSQLNIIVLSEMRFIETLRGKIPNSQITRLRYEVITQKLAVDISILLKTEFEALIQWALENNRITEDCAKSIQEAREYFLGQKHPK